MDEDHEKYQRALEVSLSPEAQDLLGKIGDLKRSFEATNHNLRDCLLVEAALRHFACKVHLAGLAQVQKLTGPPVAC